jgi:hypothetical protein
MKWFLPTSLSNVDFFSLPRSKCEVKKVLLTDNVAPLLFSLLAILHVFAAKTADAQAAQVLVPFTFTGNVTSSSSTSNTLVDLTSSEQTQLASYLSGQLGQVTSIGLLVTSGTATLTGSWVPVPNSTYSWDHSIGSQFGIGFASSTPSYGTIDAMAAYTTFQVDPTGPNLVESGVPPGIPTPPFPGNVSFTKTLSVPVGSQLTMSASAESLGYNYMPYVAGSWSFTVSGDYVVDYIPIPTLGLTIVNPPASFSYTLSLDTYKATTPIQFIARSSDPTTLISWTVGLNYTTSGGVGPFTASNISFTTTSGLAHNAALHGVGGQANISVSQDSTTATEAGTITGSAIPASNITARLTSLYAPTNVTGYTPQLLCQIAMQESTYMQFKKRTLYGVSALWPNENGNTPTVLAGTYIGLLQVPTSMATAFDWYSNTEKGANIFMNKIAAVLRYQNRQVARVTNLPAMSGLQIEDSALSLYGGFVDSTRKKKPALRYYIPGTVNNTPTWVLNPADNDISSQGNSATDYVTGVRAQTLPQ